MKQLLVIALSFLTITPLYAQIEFEERIEWQANDGYSGEKFYEMGEHGVLIRTYSTEDQGKETRWKYEKFNTDLISVWTEYVMIPNKMYADETYVSENMVHTLFKDKKGNVLMVTVNAEDEEIIEVGGEVLKKTSIVEMAVMGDYAYFEAYVKNEPYLFSLNWMTGKQKLIPLSLEGFKRKNLTIKNFQVLEESEEVFIYVKARISKKQTELFVIKLDDEGEKRSQYQLTKDIDKNLVGVSARSIGSGDYIFTGTYSDTKSSSSQGLFFCKAQGENIEFIEFYDFLSLDNFLTYLPERRQKKIEKKKKKKESKGKELKINYLIADHEIKVLDDGYLFLGEAFYPTYRSESQTSYVNGRPVTTYTQVFDGYQYTHAVLARFDKKGRMEWDQTFEMYPYYKPYYAKRFISTPDEIDDGISMVFSSGRTIKTKVVDEDGTILKDEESEEIEVEKEGDQIKYSTSDLDYWYDDYFLTYGYQKIKNKEEAKRKDRKRRIYYMAKVKY